MQKQLTRAVLALCLGVATGSAATVSWTFSATMTPTQEIPIPTLTAGAVSPTGSASATLTYDDANIGAGGSLQTSMMWADLTSPALMAHIHAIADPSACRSDNGRCGVGPVLIPIFMTDAAIAPGTTGGPLPATGSFNANVAVSATQLATLVSGREVAAPATGALYFNLHTLQNRPGEIRGDIASASAAVPEPGSMVLMAIGLIAAATGIRRIGNK